MKKAKSSSAPVLAAIQELLTRLADDYAGKRRFASRHLCRTRILSARASGTAEAIATAAGGS